MEKTCNCEKKTAIIKKLEGKIAYLERHTGTYKVGDKIFVTGGVMDGWSYQIIKSNNLDLACDTIHLLDLDCYQTNTHAYEQIKFCNKITHAVIDRLVKRVVGPFEWERVNDDN